MENTDTQQMKSDVQPKIVKSDVQKRRLQTLKDRYGTVSTSQFIDYSKIDYKERQKKINNTVQEKYEKTLVLYSTKHLYDESAYNYFSHMFRKVIITDDTSGNLGHYLINLDEVGQLSRDKAIKEYENILFDRPSDIIRKIGCWS